MRDYTEYEPDNYAYERKSPFAIACLWCLTIEAVIVALILVWCRA